MAKFTITPEDLKVGTIVKPDWYPVEVKSVEEAVAKTDNSGILKIKLLILGDSPFAGVPVIRVFSEKAPGMAKSFIEAVTKKPIDPALGGSFDFDKSVGVKLMARINNREYQGRLTNDVADFRQMV